MISFAFLLGAVGPRFGLLSYTPNPPMELRDEGTHYYILSFPGALTPADKLSLAQKGINLYYYVPDYTYIARVDDPSVLPQLKLSFWVPYHPAYRIQPGIGENPITSQYEPYRMIVWVDLFPDADPTPIREFLLAKGYRILKETVGPEPRFRVVVPRDRSVAEEIAKLEGVYWIWEEPANVVYNNTTRWSIQNHAEGDSLIWAHGLHGEGEIIGMLDSGLDWYHCMFRDTTPDGGTKPPGPDHRKVPFYYSYNSAGDEFASCDFDHGTHVAGTAAGKDIYDDQGDYSGMAYEAKIGCGDVQTGDSWDCSMGLLDINETLYNIYSDFYDAGARIMTNSWGSMSDTTYNDHSRDVDLFSWEHPDVLILFAAGNSRGSVGYETAPANSKDCLAVAALQKFPDDDNLASYSTPGPTWGDGRYKPEIAAPGGEVSGPNAAGITSADNDPTQTPSCNVQNEYGGYPIAGTSMATPAVAGAAAIVRQYFREGWYPSGSPNPSDGFEPLGTTIKATLIAGAAEVANTDPSPNFDDGWGRVLLSRSLFFADSDDYGLFVAENPSGVSTGDEETYTVEVTRGTGRLRIVLAWNDYPTASGTIGYLVNDLNLVVESPGGTQYLGNNISGGQSQPGGSPDDVNNVEVVNIDDPETGTWTIRVVANDVPEGPQPYSVVAVYPIAPTGLSGERPPATPLLRVYAQRGALRLRYGVPAEGEIKVEIYDASGRKVATIAEGRAAAGYYEAQFVPEASGVYVIRFEVDGKVLSAKATAIK